MFIMVSLSCEKDVLDVAPDGKISVDDIFADSEKVAAYLNSIYSYIPAKGTRYYFWMRGPVVWSDEAWDTDAEAEPSLSSGRVYNGDASAASHPMRNLSLDAGNGFYWDRYWTAIRKATVFISRINNAQVDSENTRKRWKAEAHLLRAYYYSELLRWFGAPLPIEREPYDLSADFSEIEQESYYNIVQFILEDCNTALGIETLPWRITTPAEAGRVNKALAPAIKSRMILYAASPLYNDGQDHWEEAYQVNKIALEKLRGHGYELYDEVHFPQTYLSDVAFIGPDKNVHAALYNEYFTNSMEYSANPVDKETIYQSYHGQGNIWNIDGIGAQDGYKSGTCPSQELVDAYGTIDGKPVLDLQDPYLDEKHTQPNYNEDNTLYDPSNPYANRDPRFYASIYYNGSKRKALWNFAEVPESYENYPAPMGNRTRIISTYVGEPRTGIHPSRRSATRTGYYERKFLHPNSGNDNPIPGANFKLFRLGEVILNFAEAAAMAGHIEEAITAVNKIRARAGMPPIPVGLSQEELVTRIKHERRVELAMEEHRYFDVRRWTSPGGDLSETDKWITAMEITRHPDGTYTYDRRPVRETPRKNYTSKWLRIPIPLDEANRLMSITGENWQRPGW